MQIRSIVQASLFHGALILGVGLGMRPFLVVERPRVQLAMQLAALVAEVPDEPELSEVVPIEVAAEPMFEEPEVAEAPLDEVQAAEDEPEAQPEYEVEPRFAVPPRLQPSRDLLVRMRPAKAEPVLAPATPAEITSPVPPDAQAEALAEHNRKPEYPASAFRRRLEADVELLITVSLAGRVTKVELLKSAGLTQAHKDMTRNAIAAVFLWRYRPAIRNGVAVEAKIRVPVQYRFRLPATR